MSKRNTGDHMNQLVAKLQQSPPSHIGLSDGLTGQCIFLFYFAKVYHHEALKATAEKLLDEIFGQISSADSINLHQGLLGIGIGMDYLMRNGYVKGNPNTVLDDLDDTLCRKLSGMTAEQHSDALTMIHALHYFCLRWKEQKQGSESQMLYQEFIGYLLEELHRSLNVSVWEAPLLFSLDYPLPQLLYVYGEVYALGFYTQRMVHLIHELSFRVFTMLPYAHASRLYLLWGVNELYMQVTATAWHEYAQLLHAHIDVSLILEEELKCNQVHVRNGYAGLYLLLQALPQYYSAQQRQRYAHVIYNKITGSDDWKLLNSQNPLTENMAGLYNGLYGTFLVLAHIERHYNISE